MFSFLDAQIKKMLLSLSNIFDFFYRTFVPVDMQIQYHLFSSPVGYLLGTVLMDKLIGLEFTDKTDLTNDNHPLFTQLKIELTHYFQGNLKSFSIPLNPQGTAFQQNVWESLNQIPYGETRTYLQQSQILNQPKAIRAVANANGKNKIVILIPCHRIIGSNGKLTGYAGGIEKKRFLLQLEQKYGDTANLFNRI